MRKTLIALFLSVVLTSGAARADDGVPLAEAIQEAAKRAGVTLVFDAQLLEHLRERRVVFLANEAKPRETLDALVELSGLEVEASDSETTLLLRRTHEAELEELEAQIELAGKRLALMELHREMRKLGRRMERDEAESEEERKKKDKKKKDKKKKDKKKKDEKKKDKKKKDEKKKDEKKKDEKQ